MIPPLPCSCLSCLQPVHVQQHIPALASPPVCGSKLCHVAYNSFLSAPQRLLPRHDLSLMLLPHDVGSPTLGVLIPFVAYAEYSGRPCTHGPQPEPDTTLQVTEFTARQPCTSVCLLPGGTCAAGYADGHVRRLSVGLPPSVHWTFQPHTAEVVAVAAAENAKLLVVGCGCVPVQPGTVLV